MDQDHCGNLNSGADAQAAHNGEAAPRNEPPSIPPQVLSPLVDLCDCQLFELLDERNGYRDGNDSSQLMENSTETQNEVSDTQSFELVPESVTAELKVEGNITPILYDPLQGGTVNENRHKIQEFNANDMPIIDDSSSIPNEPAQQMSISNTEVTTQIEPIMQPDFDIDDEAYAESVATSYVTSIASEISRGILENERLYPQYGQHSYGMPVDEEEMDRMDLQHRKYEMLIGDRHFLAPIGESPHKILDLATGTGIWALDVADMFPSAQVIGVDIAPIQPRWVAPNCHFEIDDIEDTWTYKRNDFDFIHLRDPLLVVRDWPKLCRQCFDHLKPGGWCELACIYPQVMCDDGSMPADSGFKLVCDKLLEASDFFGATAKCPTYFSKYLRDAGFVDVMAHVFKVPSSPWPKDRRLKKIGALEMANVIAGATAFGLRAFEQVFGWSKEQTEIAMVDFRRDVKNRNYHQYCQYWVVYGRKPPDSTGMASWESM